MPFIRVLSKRLYYKVWQPSNGATPRATLVMVGESFRKT